MRKFTLFVIIAVLLVLTAGTVYAAPPPDGPPGLERAIAAQEAHNRQLLTTPGVVGTAVGVTANGKAVVKVFTEKTEVAGLPGSLDGVPLVVEVTGKFMAIKPGLLPNAVQYKTTDYWPRPVPIGISTGNANDVSAGTIACRVKDTAGVYALSNTHVYAPNDIDTQDALGETVVQPGIYDGVYSNNYLGTLVRYVPIDGSIFATNQVDAAIASTTTSLLKNSTPTSQDGYNGYGVPNKNIVSAKLGMAVQKFGRTSLLTKGTISGINATVMIEYYPGWYAWFGSQIIVKSARAFILPGDSGSLLVTKNVSANPVGLLFAGNSTGTMAIANRIDLVLKALGVTIDGK